ncbi:MAG: S8 family serine peptidase [Deltaproteobacteria bacterium]|nr:S8 family serine peptidase [Deltaproteobacteria bacterium]MBI3295717.1 S8 family serine peptidase [Deltaproteobacteria bacterium]
MLRLLWKLVVLLTIIPSIGIQANPPIAKKTSLLGQLTPMKRAAKLNYPEFPKELKARIEGKTPASHPAVATSTTKDWGLSHIGFFQIFNTFLLPVKPATVPCSAAVVVAVVDTGIDYTHAELRDSVWINKGETGSWSPPPGMERYISCRDKSCNGIDDDGDGFVDDVAGWDFVNDVPLAYDTHGHGSHIAGIIASTGADGIGSPGVCPGVSIMPLKYYDASGVGYNNLQNTVRAFHYAIQMGAQIINYSGGGTDPAPAERLALEDAKNHGILVVAAAGNEGQNNDIAPYFPASYGLENIISVASINPENQLLPSSNWGPGRVHIAAPGQGIVSTLPGGQLGAMTGTSQATAFVTGTAALLLSQLSNPKDFDYHQLKRWITDGAKPLPGNAKRQILMSGVLNVGGALEAERKDVQRDKTPVKLPAVALNPGKPTSGTSLSKTQ